MAVLVGLGYGIDFPVQLNCTVFAISFLWLEILPLRWSFENSSMGDKTRGLVSIDLLKLRWCSDLLGSIELKFSKPEAA